MESKKCKNCAYSIPPVNGDKYICANDKSRKCSEYVDGEDMCEKWEKEQR